MNSEHPARIPFSGQPPRFRSLETASNTSRILIIRHGFTPEQRLHNLYEDIRFELIPYEFALGAQGKLGIDEWDETITYGNLAVKNWCELNYRPESDGSAQLRRFKMQMEFDRGRKGSDQDRIANLDVRFKNNRVRELVMNTGAVSILGELVQGTILSRFLRNFTKDAGLKLTVKTGDKHTAPEIKVKRSIATGRGYMYLENIYSYNSSLDKIMVESQNISMKGEEFSQLVKGLMSFIPTEYVR